MDLQSFANLLSNTGDTFEVIELYRIGITDNELARSVLLGGLPDGCAATMDSGYIYCCWVIDKNKEDLENFIEGSKGLGDIDVVKANIFEDKIWNKIGYNLLKSAFITKAYESGPYYKNSDGNLCHGAAVEEKEGRMNYASLKMKLYRNNAKNSFYIAVDVGSSVETESNPPNSWKDPEYILDLRPASDKRVLRIKHFLSDMKEGNAIKFHLNQKQIILGDFVSLNEEVKRI